MSEPASQQLPGDAASSPVYNVDYVGVAGVRFVPTDGELIVEYLRRKLSGHALPTAVVLEGFDAYAEHPSKLVPKLGEATEGSWYLFSPRYRKYRGGTRPRRDTDDDVGCWKAMESATKIFGGGDGAEVIGERRALTYHEHVYEVDALGRRCRNKDKSRTTRWKMVEFVCSNSEWPLAAEPPHAMLLNDYVLCKITNRALARGRGADEAETVSHDKEEEEEDSDEEEEESSGGGSEGQQHASSSGSGATAEDYCCGANVVDVGGGLTRSALTVINGSMPIFVGSDGHVGTADGGGESLDAQPAGQQQVAVAPGGGDGSPDEQQQPTPGAPNEGVVAAQAAASAAPTAAASQQAAPDLCNCDEFGDIIDLDGLFGIDLMPWDLDFSSAAPTSNACSY